MTALQPAYIGVGSNLDDPVAQVRRAFAALAGLGDTQLVAQSRLYGSRPMGAGRPARLRECRGRGA